MSAEAAAPAVMSNAARRAAVLAEMEKRLKDIWPDGDLPARSAHSFDDLEAVATRTGDAVARELMEGALAQVLTLPEGEIPRRCPECGLAFDRKKKRRTVATIRGPVRFERDYLYCEKCRRGFFPR